MYFDVTATRYKPAHRVYARSQRTAANKVARAIHRRYKAQLIANDTYELLDDLGITIPGTLFTVTRSAAGNTSSK